MAAGRKVCWHDRVFHQKEKTLVEVSCGMIAQSLYCLLFDLFEGAAFDRCHGVLDFFYTVCAGSTKASVALLGF